MKDYKADLKPFLLTLAIVVVDQITKVWVVNNIAENSIKYSWFNDLIWICHVRNTGAAFSMGASSSDFVRILFFVIGPILVLGFISIIIATRKDVLTRTQRWFAAGIVGGGIGTIIDRIFRFKTGVVDFISVKFFGIFGMDRWPTFNVSDSCVVVFVILIVVSMLFEEKNGNK